MNVKELNRDQLVQLKQRYLTQLDEEGTLNEVLYNKPELDDGEHKLSMSELADADRLVSDATIVSHYEDYTFTDEDFV